MKHNLTKMLVLVCSSSNLLCTLVSIPRSLLP